MFFRERLIGVVLLFGSWIVPAQTYVGEVLCGNGYQYAKISVTDSITTILLLLVCMTSVTSQNISEEILHQNQNMETAYNNGELTKIADYYARNATIVGPRTEVIGNEKIVAYWQGLEGRHVDWKLETIEITPYEDVVIQRGISHLRFYHEEEIGQSDVMFTLVWIQEGGQWKISIDHYSPL